MSNHGAAETSKSGFLSLLVVSSFFFKENCSEKMLKPTRKGRGQAGLQHHKLKDP